ncbi:MAG: NAD(+)/NADH kinase [Thermoplasmatota archaeon]
MRFGITCRTDDRRLRIAHMVAEYLRGKAELVAAPTIAESLKLEAVPLEKMDVDILVTIGGDGTILYALQHCDAPVFGINAGEIGFLTEIEPIEVHDGLNRLLSGDYFIENRSKIATWLNGTRLPDCANDAVLHTPRPAKLLHFEIKAGRSLDTRIRADGVVFATPTGSTSYAMSAGGPILDPSLDAILVVPIAAFSLATRPIVVPPDHLLEIRLLDPDKPAVLVLDGQVEQEIGSKDIIRLTGSDKKARFARFRHQFYARLAERLS